MNPPCAAPQPDVEPPVLPYLCSLPAGHDGDHFAEGHDGDLLATWPQDAP